MIGKTKWFHAQKGYGFLKDSESDKDVFVHHSNIVMEGFRHLNEGDIVKFELRVGKDGREQAVNVQPILTMKMVKASLKEENLRVKTMKDGYGITKYLVVDASDLIQTDKQGINFLNLAAFAGFSISEE